MSSLKRTAAISKECVACGSCVKVCPKKAIEIRNGVRAIVDETLCIGCGKCVRICPASVIELREVCYEEAMA